MKTLTKSLTSRRQEWLDKTFAHLSEHERIQALATVLQMSYSTVSNWFKKREGRDVVLRRFQLEHVLQAYQSFPH